MCVCIIMLYNSFILITLIFCEIDSCILAKSGTIYYIRNEALIMYDNYSLIFSAQSSMPGEKSNAMRFTNIDINRLPDPVCNELFIKKSIDILIKITI